MIQVHKAAHTLLDGKALLFLVVYLVCCLDLVEPSLGLIFRMGRRRSNRRLPVRAPAAAGQAVPIHGAAERALGHGGTGGGVCTKGSWYRCVWLCVSGGGIHGLCAELCCGPVRWSRKHWRGHLHPGGLAQVCMQVVGIKRVCYKRGLSIHFFVGLCTSPQCVTTWLVGEAVL
jgi:hypothetical protein